MSRKKQRPSGATSVSPQEAQAKAAAESVAAGAAAAEAAAPERTYRVVTADEPTVAVAPKDLLKLMQAWRHGRATRTVWDALSDGYIAVFCIVVFGAMIVNVILKAQLSAAQCTTGACLAGRTIMPWVVAAALGAIALSASHLFGPVLASAAEGFWLLDAPVGRRRILGKRLVLAVVLALVGGAAVGTLVALFTGAAASGIVAWAAACGLGCGGLVAAAAALQGYDATRGLRWLQSLLWLVAVAALVLVAALAAGWIPATDIEGDGLAVPGVIAALGLVLLVVGVVVAARRLDALKRTRLVSGGALVSGMQGAMFALDFGLMRDILVERDARERGHVKPRAGHGTGISALVWRDVQRLFRYPKPLAAVALTLVLPYALNALGVGVLTPLLSGLALCIVLVPTMGSLRVLTRTPGLARMMPFTMAQIKTAAIAVPGALALVWALAVTPAYLGVGGQSAHAPVAALELGLITGLAGLNGAIRWVNAKQIDFETPMMATGAGAVPPSMIFNLMRGLDMVVVTTALVIFGVPPIWPLAIGVAVLLILRSGGFSRESLEAMQEQNKRELAAAKAANQRPTQKTKVRR